MRNRAMLSWNEELLQSITTVEDLGKAGLIAPDEALRLRELGDRFKIRLTPYYASLMSGAADCPIRLQAIPDLGEDDPELPAWARELSQRVYGRNTPWHSDSIGDMLHLAVPRLTHRYQNRAILHLSSQCAVYCRFCFRKSHLNDREKSLYEGSLDPAFEYLSRHQEVRELILTGGDPLSLSDAALERVLDRIQSLSHVRSVRIHSRMAVTLPSRLTRELAEILGRSRTYHLSLVSHFNHATELTDLAREGLRRVARSGATLLNQSVLLKGVNDSLEGLSTLFQSLYEAGVIPFYLHHPDWTPATFHFRTSLKSGMELMSELQGRVSGPALPKYVLDGPQGLGKIPLHASYVQVLEEVARDGIGATLYQTRLPHTRRDPKAPVEGLYLDLFKLG